MNGDLTLLGYVFNIQNFNIHDGPGIRTLVFLKGCPLRCSWCSNPESQASLPQLVVKTTLCMGTGKCGDCIGLCPHGALSAGSDGKPVLDREKCLEDCSRPCLGVCPSRAMFLFGKRMTVADVLKVVESERDFHSRSEGGLTVSGGEPFMQPEFLLALLRQAERRYINTAVETSACCPYETFESAARHIDTVICDIKHMDAGKHRFHTGVDNARILENIRTIAQRRHDGILIRTPVIPGVNDTEEDIAAIAAFVERLPPFVRYEMLAYHRLGANKYAMLGRNYPMGEVSLPAGRMRRLVGTAASILGERLVNEH